MKKLLLLSVVAAMFLVGCSKEKSQPEPSPEPPSPYDVTITVEMPGTLSAQIPNTPFKTIKIDGKLNGTDVKYLRGIIPSLTKIDLVDASIVAGGYAYFNITHRTADNVIGQYMFSELSGGFEIILPKNIKEIKTEAFAESSGLLGVELPPITTIGYNTFFECKNLKKIALPESVTSIGDQAFKGCTSLEDIHFGANVSSIGISAFNGCSALTKIALPEKLKIISNNLFEGTSLEQVVIPAFTESISSAAFQNCSKLKKVTIGKGVKEIHSWAFNLSKNLEEVAVDNDNPYLTCESGIIYSKDFTELVLNISWKGNALEIKDGVKKIKEQAFRSISPETLKLPASLTEIGQNAFTGSVKKVYCKGVNPAKITWVVAVGPGSYVGVYAFKQAIETHASLFIPKGTTNQYAMAGYRNCFETIIEE